MGVLFLCKNVEYSCSYGNWNIFRMEMFHATMRFLENKLQTITVSHDTELEIDYASKLLDKNDTITDVDAFIDLVLDNQEYIDYLIYLNLGGLHSLLYKHDCDGFYSPGNSLDILQLLDNVKPYITPEVIDGRLPSIIKLFKTSVKTKTMITII